ncbi:MAG TPA: phosphotransferase family protein, partial [Microthrixaceae bacterium]|nr:phosphotransferase family protein [Microthrixaceae bacterium]
MTESPPARDVEAVLDGFVAWRRELDPTDQLTVMGHEHAPGGYSSETIMVELGHDGTVHERLVLKLPPIGPGIFPLYDFTLQATVQDAVAAAGIPAPTPARVELDPRWTGAPFLVMPRVEGHVVDQLPLRDHWLTKVDATQSAAVHHRYLDVVADINRLDWSGAGLGGVVPHRDHAAEVAHWREYLEWCGDGAVLVPALVDALDWCSAHLPSSEAEPALLWGDVRLGNVVFDEDRRPVAVLDWEMATIGAAEHDLAWTLTLESIQTELFGRTVPGFLDHDAAVAHYESRLGRAVRDLEWHEILAMVRSTAIMT